VPILIVESDWRATNPTLPPTIYPNTSNQHFEIAILFNVVERHGNHVFEDDKPSTAPMAKVVSYALGAYKVFIESCHKT
jgi:hypothetical protein